ncbi:MAG: hypothetical protein EOO42_00095 [Flavobacteriales bacterium]|nr:MAG: hypothetical protein EOO42_00095 [Flavobacteriales bacterium]
MFCLLMTAAEAQPFLSASQLMQGGEIAYRNKEYSKSAGLYTAALWLLTDTTTGSARYTAAYNSACSSALAGKPDSAFAVLNQVLSEQGFGTFYTQMIKDSDFDSLHGDKRWQDACRIAGFNYSILTKRRERKMADLIDPGKRINYSLFSDSLYWSRQAIKLSVQALSKKIASFNHFPKVPKKDWWTLYYIKANDTLTVPFLVHIPSQYDPQVKTPLYVFLHGGVGRASFSDPLDQIRLETPLLQRVFLDKAFVILPFASKGFNWLYHQQAFETILREIAQVKGFYNIDDNKVYIGGHSDGARGAFWFALNQRTPFASFFGMNYFPILLSGNTPFRNLSNDAPFKGISGIEDKGFDIRQLTQIVDYARFNGANWQNFAMHGDHTLPYDTPDSVIFLVDQVKVQIRNPVPQKLQWETDDIRSGRYYWLNVTELDTVQNAATWHDAYNPVVTSLKTGKDEVRNLNKKKSGAVMAEVKGCDVYLKTSRVGQIQILVPKQWAEQFHTLAIHLNEQPVYLVQIHASKTTLLHHFLKNKDRALITVDEISVFNR